jgi:hypothetical protein
MGGGVDVIGKLYRLNEKLDALTEDDRAFVSEAVTQHKQGRVPKIDQVLRIVDMPVPGEEPAPQPVWNLGTVSVGFVALDQVIWRYMPLEQLIALLWRKSVHFSPLAMMDDASEGQLPPRAFEETKQQLPAHFFQADSAIDAGAMTKIMVEQRRRDACLSCWYISDSDCLKMWRQYAPNNGVAIQSTVRRLASSLQESQTPIRIAPVSYFAPEDEERYVDEAFYGSLFIKRDPYRHEKELRAVAYRPNVGHGIDEPVIVDILIERLVLSPELKDWAVPAITEAIRRFDFAGLVETSALNPVIERQ